jgi:hypothetical protein
MANKQWGIWVDGSTKGWLTDGGWTDDNGDWHDKPAVYETKGEATADAKWFTKDSKHTYTAKAF